MFLFNIMAHDHDMGICQVGKSPSKMACIWEQARDTYGASWPFKLSLLDYLFTWGEVGALFVLNRVIVVRTAEDTFQVAAELQKVQRSGPFARTFLWPERQTSGEHFWLSCFAFWWSSLPLERREFEAATAKLARTLPGTDFALASFYAGLSSHGERRKSSRAGNSPEVAQVLLALRFIFFGSFLI